MKTKKSIALEISKGMSLSQKDIDFINSKFNIITLKKGDRLLAPNTVINYQYYVSSGCLRSYFVGKSGKEHTVQFAIEDWWISDYTAYFSSETSIMNIECIQEATIHKISRKDMETLYTYIPGFESYFRKKLEKAFASFQRKILGYLSQSALERYLTFITNYPNIEKSVKNYHIASYLGITTESLSRIRKIHANK